jgi:hypothetical protein
VLPLGVYLIVSSFLICVIHVLAFENKRKTHYNEYQALQEWRKKHLAEFESTESKVNEPPTKKFSPMNPLKFKPPPEDDDEDRPLDKRLN